MSLEEKIQAILMLITESVDQEIEQTMQGIADAQDRLAQTRDGRAKAQKPAGQATHAKETEQQREIEKLQLKLQKLIERRKQMFELMSNLSSKFNEMAKTAIQNLGRA